MQSPISVNVYRSHHEDCTLGGATSFQNTLLLFGEEADLNFIIGYCQGYGCDYMSQLRVVKRHFAGKFSPYAEPIYKPGERIQMFGGNFVYTSDSRFSEIVGEGFNSPLPVHDRFESQELYDALSN